MLLTLVSFATPCEMKKKPEAHELLHCKQSKLWYNHKTNRGEKRVKNNSKLNTSKRETNDEKYTNNKTS